MLAVLILAAAAMSVSSSPNGPSSTTGKSALVGRISPSTPSTRPASPSDWQVSAAYRAVPGLEVIACPSTLTCYAAGTDSSYRGYILETSDAGVTWRTEVAFGGALAISCPSTSVCFAIAPDGVLVTQDSGTTWKFHLVHKGDTLTGIACPSTTTCYAVGYEHSGKPYILVTRDSGASWRAASVPPETVPTWLAGGEHGILETTPSPAWDVACPSTKICYVIAGAEYLVTTDAGHRWKIGNGVTKGVFRHEAFLGYIACPSTTMCVASEQDANQNPPVEGFVVTTDGGQLWTSVTTPVDVGPGLESLVCPSTTECVATHTGTGFSGGEVLVSTDSAASWHVSASWPGLVGQIACPTTTTCMVGDTKGPNGGAPTDSNLVLTTDAGSTWTVRELPQSIGEVAAIACPSSSDCYATVEDGILATVDSGSTWALQTLPSGAVDPTTIACPSPTTCYVGAVLASTADTENPISEILTTTDSARSWTITLVLPEYYNVTGLACPSTTTCYAAARTVFITTDSGATWHSQPTVTGTDIACSTTTTCLMGEGPVFATTDGWNTWVTGTAPTDITPSPTEIACTSTTVCIIVSRDDFDMINSLDADVHWNRYLVPKNIGLNAVACRAQGVCYAVAMSAIEFGPGALLSTRNGGATWAKQTLPVAPATLTDVTCLSVTTCYVVGEGGGSSLAGVGALILKRNHP